MYSMTGYGKATEVSDGVELTVELKSVNHRFLDIGAKLPRIFSPYEDVVRTAISAGVKRGHVDVFVNYKFVGERNYSVTVDYSLLEAYLSAANDVAQKYGLKNDFQVTALMKTPDVVKAEQADEPDEILKNLLKITVEKAVTQLNAMRLAEGMRLKADLTEKLAVVSDLVAKLKVVAPDVVVKYRKKLQQRMEEALSGVEVDESKLLNEVAFFADKSNVDEELTRLSSHVANAYEILGGEGPVGRKLDFLVQELNREANTVCSKSNDVALTNVALALKNEIEKIREQIQNLE